MKREFKDQLDNHFAVSFPPKRIISLVPSQTELLADLSLDNNIVGITKFCVHPPEWRKTKTIIGGTKNFDFQTIGKLQPDLVIGNKEENYPEGIAKLQENYPVWMSDISTLEEATSMIKSIGKITDRDLKAQSIIKKIADSFSSLPLRNLNLTVLYLIWRKPWMAVGSETFIHAMLDTIGFNNCVSDLKRYPELSSECIASLKPDLIFLSSEPYPFSAKHIPELKQISPESNIVLVDGEMFSWYGSRLIKAPLYFNFLLRSIGIV